ncbi:hypothetical protein BX600DRAFT_434294 [Xylariales sp. PMI_506]|nr:hypothetical protein BX600DRAFT_434294 [Xylariales sp. PMI_506]
MPLLLWLRVFEVIRVIWLWPTELSRLYSLTPQLKILIGSLGRSLRKLVLRWRDYGGLSTEAVQENGSWMVDGPLVVVPTIGWTAAIENLRVDNGAKQSYGHLSETLRGRAAPQDHETGPGHERLQQCADGPNGFPKPIGH